MISSSASSTTTAINSNSNSNSNSKLRKLYYYTTNKRALISSLKGGRGTSPLKSALAKQTTMVLVGANATQTMKSYKALLSSSQGNLIGTTQTTTWRRRRRTTNVITSAASKTTDNKSKREQKKLSSSSASEKNKTSKGSKDAQNNNNNNNNNNKKPSSSQSKNTKQQQRTQKGTQLKTKNSTTKTTSSTKAGSNVKVKKPATLERIRSGAYKIRNKVRTPMNNPEFGTIRWLRKQRVRAYKYWRERSDRAHIRTGTFGSEDRMPRFKPWSSYKPGDASANPYLREKKLTIEELKYTEMGRAKLQTHRQSIAYPKFCLDVINDEMEDIYFDQVGQLIRFYAVYPDGRVAVCQTPQGGERELRDLFRMLEINPKQLLPELKFGGEIKIEGGSKFDAQAKFLGNYFVPGLLILIVYGVVFYTTRFQEDWDDRQRMLEVDLKKEEQKAAEKEDPLIIRIKDSIILLKDKDGKDAQRYKELQKELQNRQAAIAQIKAFEKDEEMKKLSKKAQERGKDEAGIFDPKANAFLALGSKVVKARVPNASEGDDMKTTKNEKKKETTDNNNKMEDDEEEDSKRKMKKGKLNSKMAMRDHDSEVILFEDVAGVDNAKIELEEVVDFFLKPEKYKASGARTPKGVLLTGPPGCGKTLLARAVAGEAGATFFSITASEFVEMFVGVGAARVRDLFAQAKRQAPSIIFIDELDAVGRPRGGGGSGNDERDQTLNQMLVELDGFATDLQVVVIAATNRADVLDQALVRAGRFDRKVVVSLPEFNGRIAILQVHAKKKKLAEEIDWEMLAEEMEGFSGAQLAQVVNMACLQAAKADRDALTNADFRIALDIEIMGKVLPFNIGEENEKRLALVHAAAAIAYEYYAPDIARVSFVTVLPRESNLTGQVCLLQDPDNDRTKIFTKSFHRRLMRVSHAPGCFEELYYGFDKNSKASAPYDIRARELAISMVHEAGMSDVKDSYFSLSVNYDVLELSTFLKDKRQGYLLSSVDKEMYGKAEFEIREIMHKSRDEAMEFVRRQRPAIEELARRIIASENKTVLSYEIRDIIKKFGVIEDIEGTVGAFANTRTPIAEWDADIPTNIRRV